MTTVDHEPQSNQPVLPSYMIHDTDNTTAQPSY